MVVAQCVKSMERFVANNRFNFIITQPEKYFTARFEKIGLALQKARPIFMHHATREGKTLSYVIHVIYIGSFLLRGVPSLHSI